MPLRRVLIRDPQEEFDTRALPCTYLTAAPEQIVSRFIKRRQMEGTLQEVRQCLGLETQRHWSEQAILQPTPALLALFSLVALFAHRRMAHLSGAVRPTAWYEKTFPAFSGTLALARKELWPHATFCRSLGEEKTVKVLRALMERLTDAVCYAA